MNRAPTIITGFLAVLCVALIWVSAGGSQDGHEGRDLRAEALSSRSKQWVAQKQAVRPAVSAEEKLVRDAYARLMRYQTAARDEWDAKTGRASQVEDYLTFELRDIHSGPIKELSGQALSDLVTVGSGNVLRIEPTYLRQGKDPAHAYYVAEWITAASGDQHRVQGGEEQLAGFDRYTSYEVTVRLGGQERTYRALALHRQGDGSLRSNSEILDNITSEMNTILHDESPRVRSPWQKYSKSALYLAVVRTIKETKEAGQPLIPAEAPIGYLPGDDVSPNAQDAQTMAANAVCPDLRILRDGNDITGTTQNVIVGERINLTLETQPEGDVPTNIQWTVPGNAIGNYVVNGTGSTGPTSASVTALSGLDSDAIAYYWIDGANGLTVSVSVTVFGTNLTKSATFNVQKPTATITINSGTIAVGPLIRAGGLWLHFGDPDGVPGVAFGQTISMPSGFSPGTVQWTQVVTDVLITGQPNVGNQLTLNGSNVIDVQFSYPFVYNGTLEDSPDVQLDPDMSHWTVSTTFVSYLMFRPAGTNTIWVPLRQVPWSWNAAATRTGSPNVWSLDPGPTKSVGPDVNSTAEPIWSGRVQDLQLH